MEAWQLLHLCRGYQRLGCEHVERALRRSLCATFAFLFGAEALLLRLFVFAFVFDSLTSGFILTVASCPGAFGVTFNAVLLVYLVVIDEIVVLGVVPTTGLVLLR